MPRERALQTTFRQWRQRFVLLGSKTTLVSLGIGCSIWFDGQASESMFRLNRWVSCIFCVILSGAIPLWNQTFCRAAAYIFEFCVCQADGESNENEASMEHLTRKSVGLQEESGYMREPAFLASILALRFIVHDLFAWAFAGVSRLDLHRESHPASAPDFFLGGGGKSFPRPSFLAACLASGLGASRRDRRPPKPRLKGLGHLHCEAFRKVFLQVRSHLEARVCRCSKTCPVFKRLVVKRGLLPECFQNNLASIFVSPFFFLDCTKLVACLVVWVGRQVSK